MAITYTLRGFNFNEYFYAILLLRRRNLFFTKVNNCKIRVKVLISPYFFGEGWGVLKIKAVRQKKEAYFVYAPCVIDR